MLHPGKLRTPVTGIGLSPSAASGIEAVWVADGMLWVRARGGEATSFGLVSPRVASVALNDQLELTLVYDDGRSINAGRPEGIEALAGLQRLEDDPSPRLGGDLDLADFTVHRHGGPIVLDGGVLT